MPASGTASGAYRPSLPSMGHRERRFTSFRRGRTKAAPVPTERPAVARGKVGPVVLDMKDLRTYFFTYEGVVRALDGVNLKVRSGETTGLVGETGCGKSVTAFSVTRLISEPGRVVAGEIRFKGANLLWGLEREAKFKRIKGSNRIRVVRSFRRIKAANERMAAIRGRGIAMIFQEPMQAMNPVFSISDQLGEALLLHKGVQVIDGVLEAHRALNAFGEGGPAPPVRAAQRPSRQDSGILHPVLEEDVRRRGGAEGESEEEGALSDSVNPIDTLLDSVGKSPEEVRAAAKRFGDKFHLPTLGTQMFYALKGAEVGRDYRPRVLRAMRRMHLSLVERSYLRWQRKLIQLQQTLDQVHLKEMATGQAQRARRGSIRSQMALVRLSRFWFRLPGLSKVGRRPIKDEIFWQTVTLLEGVRIANPVQVAKGYPHELSGGMLQRVMIAMALSCNPELLLADEPTTALDVTIQAQILDLMRHLKEEVGTGIVLITHDLGVIAEVCDRVNVMYAGRIVESAQVGELFRRPLHPYTQGLLSSIPRFDQPDKELQSIPGSVPNLIRPPPGCRFHPRCPYAMPVCKEIRPEETPVGEDHWVACHLYGGPEAEGTTEPVTAPLEIPVADAPAAPS